ncbi:major capsid family protein [Martelella alba]|uniref:DUF2184 domain-containing protein n=1 Tax=Martelella alba TaxID=2590451 RepID=A0ABY2SDT1_9HYPH|nr:major capsid family protein [Martelella alba]TKI02734.1 DUF2184 domain-containing protein [Martelella alba]
MAAITPSYELVHPSYVMPEIILQYQQASGAFNTLASRNPLVRLGEGDLYVYIKKLDIRTQVAGSQVANANQLPSVAIDASMKSTATYMLRARAIYDHHDTAAAGNWGVALPEAQRLGMRQGIFQQMRTALLTGFNPVNGEGLLNTNGATEVNLPTDSNGNDTVVTYDNGQMAIFLLTQIQALKTRTLQMGTPARINILGPQRTLGAFEYQGIVQLTQFQRDGAGSATTSGVVKDILELNGDTIDWTYDDTLIGQGANGTDAVIINMPEVKKPVGGQINTNEFAKLSPGLEACAMMLCDMAAPREIPTPIAGGAIDVLSELRSTSGWAVRPESITIINMQYS